MCIQLKPPFSRHKGIGVQFTDEPTGALDSRSTDELLGLFARINAGGQTILMVTHSVKAASKAGRRSVPSGIQRSDDGRTTLSEDFGYADDACDRW